MRLLSSWAAVAGAAVFCATGCLTSQDNPGGGEGVEDPPVTFPKGGSGGSSKGGDTGDDTGGSSPRGGRSGAGGAGGSSQGGSDGVCSDDTDCELRVDRPICSVPTGECVECLTVSDCGSSSRFECVNNECRAIVPCATMDECPVGTVCNTSTDQCVECVASTECRADEICAGNACHTRCTVDGHCAPLGLVCDVGRGYCVACVSDSDCPDERNCQGGTCVRDICVAGSGSCEGTYPTTYLTTCNEAGSVMSSGMQCVGRTTCAVDGTTAACQDWACDPGVTGCSTAGDAVVECSEDGLEANVLEECGTGEFCIASTLTCMAAVCSPSMRFCMGNTVQQCDSTGSGYTLYQTCTTAQFCDDSTPPATCRALLCTPNQPVCNGNIFTTCNSTGTGYTAGGTDCTRTMELCSPSGCSAGVVDTIPATPALIGSPYSGYLMVNFYSVTTSRTLTKIEYYVNPTSATAMTWHVYESTTQTGTYTRISTSNSTSTTGPGYQSSPVLAVPLVAGRYYAIGAHWSSPAMDMGYQTGAPSQAVSFGALFNSYPYLTTPSTTLSYSSSTSNFVPQRLTTIP